MFMSNNLPTNKDNMNIILVTDEGFQLWLGNYSAATNLRLLNDKKIKHVAALIDVQYPPEMGVNHKIFHAYDSPSYKISQHFQQAYDFINQALKGGNILVHCAAGISRSTTCVLAYLMKAKGFRFREALTFTKSKRTIANPNYGFQNQLVKFDILLRQKQKQQEKTMFQNLRKSQTKNINRYSLKKNNRKIFPSLSFKHNFSYIQNKLLTPSKNKFRQNSLIQFSQQIVSISNQFVGTHAKLDKLKV